MSCINCDKRYPGCHDHCEDYAKEQARNKERKEKIKRNKQIEAMANHCAIESVLARKRRGYT